MLVQLDARGHLLAAGRAGGVQVLLELAVPHRGAVRRAVRRVHVAHGAVEVAGCCPAGLAGALHLADLGGDRLLQLLTHPINMGNKPMIFTSLSILIS